MLIGARAAVCKKVQTQWCPSDAEQTRGGVHGDAVQTRGVEWAPVCRAGRLCLWCISDASRAERSDTASKSQDPEGLCTKQRQPAPAAPRTAFSLCGETFHAQGGRVYFWARRGCSSLLFHYVMLWLAATTGGAGFCALFLGWTPAIAFVIKSVTLVSHCRSWRRVCIAIARESWSMEMSEYCVFP